MRLFPLSSAMLVLLATGLCSYDSSAARHADASRQLADVPIRSPDTYEPQYCRRGTIKRETGEEKVIWNIRGPIDLSDLVTDGTYNYEIYKSYCTADTTHNDLCINQGERIRLTKKSDTEIYLKHYKIVDEQEREISQGVLTLESDHRIWAQGRAIQGGTAAGEYRLFRAADQRNCRHSVVKEIYDHLPTPACKGIVLEYFDDGDTFAAGQLPKFGDNVVRPVYSKSSDKFDCRYDGFEETGDGEGDYGPDKK